MLIRAGGAFCLAFAAFHLFFPLLFRWQAALAPLDAVNRGIVRIMNLCLTFLFAAFGFLALRYAEDMLFTALGHALLVVLAAFWLVRALEQWWFFGLRDPRSLAFFGAFLAGSALFVIPWFGTF